MYCILPLHGIFFAPMSFWSPHAMRPQRGRPSSRGLGPGVVWGPGWWWDSRDTPKKPSLS